MNSPNEVEIVGCGISSFADFTRHIPALAEERWRIIDEGDRWVVWFAPLFHPELWQEVGEFATEQEAVEYMKTC